MQDFPPNSIYVITPSNLKYLQILFDKNIGLITFTIDKKVLISNKLSKENQKRLGVENNQFIQDLPVFGREEFLEYHNQFIFQK